MKRLDRDAIRNLKPGETVFGSGIEAACQPDGDIRYCTATRLDGEKLHRVLGFASDGMTPARAEAALAKMKVDIRAGRLQLPKGRTTQLSFREIAAKYIAELEATGGRNVGKKKTHLNLHLIPFFKDQRALTKSLIGRYKKHRADQGAAVGTTNRELSSLNHMLVVAAEEGWIPGKPLRIQKQAEQRQRRVALTEAECAALLAAALNDSNTYCHLFVSCAISTGMRHAEILAMRFEHIDFANRRLDIPVAKSGRRQQPIPDTLCATLLREREMADDPNGWVFPSRRPELDGCGHITRMDRPFDRAVKAAGIERARVTPHTLRHTAITRLIQEGVDLPTIQKISGHKTLAMILEYAQIHAPHIDKAVALLGREALAKAPQKPHSTETAAPAAPPPSGQVIAFPRKKG
jgi:integrase